MCSAPDLQIKRYICLRNTGDNEFGNKYEDVGYGFAICSIMFSENLSGKADKL